MLGEEAQASIQTNILIKCVCTHSGAALHAMLPHLLQGRGKSKQRLTMPTTLLRNYGDEEETAKRSGCMRSAKQYLKQLEE